MYEVIGFFLVLALGAAIGAPLVLRARRQARRALAEARRLRTEHEEIREILSAAPDGLFLWDHVTGDSRCSGRLAILLGLKSGKKASFDEVMARFEGEAAEALGGAVAALRADGAFFDMLLPAAGRMLHVVGSRASTADDRVLADILWVREATAGMELAPAADANAQPTAAPLDENEKFRALMDALPIGVWLRDAEGQLVYANRSGREPAKLGGELNQRVREEGRALSEPRLVGEGRERRMLEINEGPMEGWSGTLGYSQATGSIDPFIAESRSKVLENLSTAVAVFGTNRRLGFFNPAFVDIWGLDQGWLEREPTLGQVLDELRANRRLPEHADFPAFRKEQSELFDALTAPTESLMHRPDGSTLRAMVAPHPSGGLIFTWEDMTDRLDLERSYNTLIAVQRATLDNLYEGVAVFGSDGRLNLSNPVFADLWRIDDDALDEDLHIADFVEYMRPYLTVSDADWAAHRDHLVAELMGRKPGGGRLLRADGRVVDHGHVPLPDGAVLLGYLDVTDSVRVQHALRQRAEALQEADRLKSHFIANVSYEVRTPLNTVVGFAELLAEEYFGTLNPEQKEYAQGIVDTARNLMAVIGDILDLATIEAGLMRLELDTVDLNSVLGAVMGLVTERAKRKSLAVEFECEDDIGWIVADERRLRQVVFNLLSNAVDFTPPQGAVTLSARREGNEVAISVDDTGVGIPESEQEKVLQAFQRGPSGIEATGGGPGLGLSLVTRFVELHGGRLEIDSRPGEGTTIICWLPAGGAGQSEVAAEAG